MKATTSACVFDDWNAARSEAETMAFVGVRKDMKLLGELSALEGVVGGQEVEVQGGKRPVIQAEGGLLPPVSAL